MCVSVSVLGGPPASCVYDILIVRRSSDSINRDWPWRFYQAAEAHFDGGDGARCSTFDAAKAQVADKHLN